MDNNQRRSSITTEAINTCDRAQARLAQLSNRNSLKESDYKKELQKALEAIAEAEKQLKSLKEQYEILRKANERATEEIDKLREALKSKRSEDYWSPEDELA